MLASQIRSLVIRPALEKLNLWSLSAEELVLGTAIVESGLTYLRQHNDGPAVCRLCYYRKPDALPEAGDIEGQAAFWKQHYNTPLGKGTVTKYVYKVSKVLKEAGG